MRQQKEAGQILLKRVKDALLARGTKTIRGLARCFETMQYGGSRVLDKQQLKIGLQEHGVQLSMNELDILFVAMDKDGSSTIDFDEFLVAIRGKLNPTRKAIVDQAFRKFDKTGDGFITADDLKYKFISQQRGVYNVRMHPKFKNGQMTEKQIFDEFLVHFGDVDNDGKLTYQEWIDYYSAVSASVDNDEHFVLIMKMAWKL